jgi:hypothetical protein
MLQHNINRKSKAHLAHFAVVTLHALCCGLPVFAILAAALTGAASGSALQLGAYGQFHDFLHAHELWIVAVSAALVIAGAIFEARLRRGGGVRGIPVLFTISVFCFFANAGLILAHRATA